MTENELRRKVVSIAESLYGCNEADGSHRKIIDGYNAVTPLPSGYRMTYYDAWCATTISYIAIKAGLTDIIPRECGCERMINLFKKMGRFVEDDNYTPQIADIIFYDWQDSGYGDNTGFSDHVGMVVSVSGKSIKVIEGNMSNAVGYRTIQVNARYIRGYGVPNYASKATSVKDDDKVVDTKPTTSTTTTSISLEYKIGDIVKFTGTKHYANANAASGATCKAGTAKVTGVSKNAKHPYHLVAEKSKGSTVYGWVNTSDIAGKISSTATSGSGTSTTVNSNAKVDSAKSFSKSLAGTYKTTSNLNMRAGAGTSKTILVVIPKGGNVTCYGYYTLVNGVKWYYVTYKNNKGIRYNGFVSSKYLKK